jgi:predicted O-linked N-acetylglucosamine transferase (SPINDLY family)
MATLIRRSLQTRLDEAARLHDRGELAEAARRYESVLKAAPDAWQPAYLLGLVRWQEADFPSAEKLLQRAVRLNHRHADAWFYLGEVLAQSGRDIDAERAYRAAADQEPPHAMASFKLGLIAEQNADVSSAEAAYRRALRGKADFPEALSNLANLLHSSGQQSSEAEASLKHAIALRKDFVPAYINLAALLSDGGRLDAACDVLHAGVDANPNSAQLHFRLGAALAEAGRGAAAVAMYERALAIDPGHAETYNNIGVLFLEQGFAAEAKTCFERAVAYNAELVEAHNNLGNALMRFERYDEARLAFERAIALQPRFAAPRNGIGMVLAELGRPEAAVDAFRAALAIDPEQPECEADLAAALRTSDRFGEAQACYARAMQGNPSVALRIKAALAVPPIPMSRMSLMEDRRRIESELERLSAAALITDEADLLRYPETAFYLAYHGMNDRPILQSLAQLYGNACSSLNYRGRLRARSAERPIRLGFVSRFLYSHSVGHFFNPIIEHLASKEEFDVRVFTIGHKRDAVLEQLLSTCRQHVALSPLSLVAARSAIEGAELDVLIYTDIGMDPFTYFLSFSRLAPVQCVLHGHSDTSGVPAIDWFVSSRLLEPDDAQSQYSERLALLDTLPMVLRELPLLPRLPSRAELGLPSDGRLYVCPMKLHKLHPDMDALITSILQEDAEAYVLLFQDDKCVERHHAVRARMESVIGVHAKRLTFLPFVSDQNRFRAILSHAAVVLDTPHHGGGTTCNLAFSVGAPVVSLVGETCRGRGPLAYYTLMGIDGLVARTPDQYVAVALGVGRNPSLRTELSRQILERRDRFAQNDAVLASYVNLFLKLASRRGER